MKIKSKKALNFGLFAVICFSVYAVLLFMNYYTPMTADDFYYYFSCFDGQRVDGIKSIILSMKAHYYTMNGRLIPHSIVQLFSLCENPMIFKVLNSAVFMFLGVIIYKISNVHKTSSPIKLLFIYLGMFLVVPVFGQTILWFDGAMNYLWGITLILFVLYFFNEKLFNPEKYTSVVFIIISAVMAFLAGGWSENSSAILIMLEFFYGILYAYKYRNTKSDKKRIKIPLFYILDFVFSSISYVLMITAPANIARKDSLNYNSISSLPWRLNACITRMRQYLYILILFFGALLLLSVLIKVFDNKANKYVEINFDKYHIVVALLFFASSLVANFIMIAASYPDRAAIGPVIFLFISICMLISFFKFKKFKFILYCVNLIVLLCLAVFMLGGMQSVKTYGEMSMENEQKIIAQIESGKTDVLSDAIVSDSKFTSGYGLSTLSAEGSNGMVAKYYGVDSVILAETKEAETSTVEKVKDGLFTMLFGGLYEMEEIFK